MRLRFRVGLEAAGVTKTLGTEAGVMLMAAAGRYGQTLQITICEIERGVFYATYRLDDRTLQTDELPTYQVGKSVVDARQRIERSAQAIGYDTIGWTQTASAPVFPEPAEPTHRRPATAYSARRSL